MNCRLTPLVVSKLVDLHIRNTGKTVIGLLTGIRSLGDMLDIVDVIPLSLDVNEAVKADEIIRMTQAHMKIFTEELVLGYFVLTDSEIENKVIAVHEFFLYQVGKAPIRINGFVDGTFKLKAYDTDMPEDVDKLQFSEIKVSYILDYIDRLAIATDNKLI